MSAATNSVRAREARCSRYADRRGNTSRAAVRVDTRIEPAHVAHRPMDDKAALDLTRPSPPQCVEPLLAPRRDRAVARNLGRPEARDELVRIGRLVGAGNVVDVKF